MPKKTKAKEAPPPPTTSIETFRDCRGWSLDTLKHDSPSCFNGIVAIRRYRVTCEEIEEPVEVLQERLLKLWRESDNHHSWQPMVAAASRIGMTLNPKEFGKDRPKRRY